MWGSIPWVSLRGLPWIKKPKGLVHANVGWQQVFTGNVPAGSWFESIGRGTLVYANGFTRDAIHKCGEASIELPRKVFLGNENYMHKVIVKVK
jgi:hypothetical protein